MHVSVHASVLMHMHACFCARAPLFFLFFLFAAGVGGDFIILTLVRHVKYVVNDMKFSIS